MIHNKLLGAGLLALSMVPSAFAESTNPQLGLRDETPAHLAFTGATIVVGPGELIEDGTLVIDDGRVVSVARRGRVPKGATEVDLDGAWIFPGFVEPYGDYGLGHLESSSGGGRGGRGGRRPVYEGQREGPDSWNDAIHADRDWATHFKPSSKAAEAHLKRGVTTVQSVRHDGILRGRGFVASLAEGLPGELLLVADGPHFASFDKGNSRQQYPSSLMGSIALLRQTFHDAAWYREARAAWDRNPAQEMPEVNAAIAAVAANAAPVVFETDDKLTMLRAARLADEFGLSLVHVGSNDEYARLQEIAALDATLILPLDFPAKPDVASFEDELDYDLGDLRHWERAPANPAALHRAGVRFAFTAHDLGKKQKFLEQVRTTIERGLPADVALAALTTVPADLAGVGEVVGTLQAGKRADFLVASADLLTDDKAKLQEIWVDGQRRHRVEDPTPHDYRGTYRPDDARHDALLLVGGEPGKYKAKLKNDGELSDVDGFKADASGMRFRTDLPGGGSTRVAVVRVGDGFRATLALPDGSMHRFPLDKISDEADFGEDDEKKGKGDKSKDDDEDGDEDDDPTEMVSRLTFPNMAFGWESAPQAEDILIQGATVWTLDERGKLDDADLLIRDGKIAQVGKNLSAPSGVRRIDGSGKHVTPGMIDEHSHIAISRGVNEGSHAVTAEVRIGDVVNSDDISIYRALAGGTTAAQLLHGSANPIGGQAQVIKLRWGMTPEAMKVDSAPPSIKFALGENVKQSNWGDDFTTRYPQSRMGVMTIMRDRFNAALDYAKEWEAWEAMPASDRAGKVPPRRDMQLDAILAIVRSEMFIHCHSYVQSEILALMRLAEDYDFRIQTFTHILEGYKVAQEMAEHGAGGSTFSDWWAYKFEVYDAIPYNTCLMHEAGVLTSINSDSAELIRRLNQEAAKSVAYCDNVDEVEALKMASLNAAKQLRIDDRTGSLEVGKDADFVIWNDHPLSIRARPDSTWVDGIEMFSIERDRELRAQNRAEKQALIQKALKGGGKGGKGSGGPRRRRPGTEDRLWDCEDVVDVWQEAR